MNIITKSICCRMKLLEWKKQHRIMFYSLDIVSVFVFFLPFIFSEFLLGDLSGLSLLSDSYMLMNIICLICVGIITYINADINKFVINNVSQFEELFSRENLIICDDGILCSCDNVDFRLSYSEIKSVLIQHMNNSTNYKKEEFKNDILTIIATNGSQYKFYSFDNANELKLILTFKIDAIMENNKNPGKDSGGNSPINKFLHKSPQSGVVPVKPIIENDEIKCPICNELQRKDRYICFKCGQPFINGQPDVPYWCNKCGKPGPYGDYCSNCGSSVKTYNNV